MKLFSPHYPAVIEPSIIDVAHAIDELELLKTAHPSVRDCFVLIEDSENTGAFIRAGCIDQVPLWRVEVCNSDEASLRALRQPVTRGKAVELLATFVRGDRSLGNGLEWLDVDLPPGRPRSPTSAFALGIATGFAAAAMIWFLLR